MAHRIIPLNALLLGSALLAGAAATNACSPEERAFQEPNAGTGGTELVCEPGTSVPCYEGPDGTKDVGVCKEGSQVCNADGSGYGACEGQVVPSEELCSAPEDEDCDGESPLCPLTHLASTAFDVVGTNSIDLVDHIAFDPAGNAVISTGFTGEVTVGGMSFQSTGAGDDLILAALDPKGGLVWGRAFGGDGVQDEAGVAVDAAGNIYVAGNFTTGLNLGAGFAYTSAGGYDVFVAKLDPMGQTVKVIVAGDAMGQRIERLAIDEEGNLFVAGTFTGALTFPNGPTLNAASGPTKLFIVKLDPNLETIAALANGGTGTARVSDMTVGGQGNVLLTGDFDGTVSLDGIAQTAIGENDVFIGKLSGADLKALWVRKFGSQQTDRGKGVDFDSKGNILVSGSYQAEMLLGTFDLISESDESLFVAKLMPSGDPIWAKSFGGSLAGQNTVVVKADSTDAVVVSGGISILDGKPALDFGGGPLAGFGAADVFLAKLDGDGNHIASKSFGNLDPQITTAMAVAAGDRILIAGRTAGPMDLGGGPVGSGDPKFPSLFMAVYSP
jgi:hypothetical protein